MFAIFVAVVRALVPPFAPLPRGKRRRGAALGLFFLGAAGALLFVESATGPVPWLVLSAVATGSYAAARSEPASRARRILRFLARALAASFHALWICEALLCASMLSWTIPWWGWVTVASLAAGAAVTMMPRAPALAVPPALPLGAFCAACLIGWAREEWRIRCDDVLAVTAQRSAQIVVPVRDDFDRCVAGAWVPNGRYPRKVWQAADGARVVFTTQEALHEAFRPTPLPSRISGLVCESELPTGPEASAMPVNCLIPSGKAHAIVEDADHDRLLVGVLGGLDGRAGGIVAVTRSAPLREVGRAVLAQGGNFYLDPASDLLGEFGDEGHVLDLIRASDFAPVQRDIPANFLGPDFVRYDPRRHEGVACSASGPLRTIDGEASLAIAFVGVPFSPRALAPSSRYPSSWISLSWGCDWTADRRQVFVAVSTLGQIVTVDRRSGDIVHRSFAGFGVRPVTFDPRRGRLYVGNFLRGDVLALDVATGLVERRWFAGRFVRDIELTPDGTEILVTSNLGIVRIRLDG